MQYLKATLGISKNCFMCNKTHGLIEVGIFCSCKDAWYCSKECMFAHYDTHKFTCISYNGPNLELIKNSTSLRVIYESCIVTIFLYNLIRRMRKTSIAQIICTQDTNGKIYYIIGVVNSKTIFTDDVKQKFHDTSNVMNSVNVNVIDTLIGVSDIIDVSPYMNIFSRNTTNIYEWNEETYKKILDEQYRVYLCLEDWDYRIKGFDIYKMG